MAYVSDNEAIIAQVFPASVQRTLGNFQGIRSGTLDVLAQRQLLGYTGARRAQDCKDAGPSTGTNLQKASKATGMAASVWASVAPFVTALQVVPVVGAIIGGAITAFATIANIFSHHSQAVAREQGTLCAVVPQVNEAVLQLDQEYANGNFSYLEASAQLDVIDDNFRAATAAITKDSANQCNAACVVSRQVDALVIERKQIYAGQQPWLYYVKHYWWAGLVVAGFWFFFSRRA